MNAASDDISVMAVRADGSLELIGAPVGSRGIAPASLAISGTLLYVANKGDAVTPPSYVGFRVNPNGTLARIKRRIELNIGDNPAHVLFNRSGSMLIGTRSGGRVIDCFSVRPNGRLRPLGQLGDQPGPFGAAFNPAVEDQLVVTDARLPGAHLVRVSDRGELSLLSSVSNAPERAACWVTVDAAGRFAWVANTGTNSLSLYVIGRGDRLQLAGTHSTLAFGRAPFEVVLDRTGQFLYELNVAAGFQSVHVMRVTGQVEEGGLSDLATAPIPAGSAPIGLVLIEW